MASPTKPKIGWLIGLIVELAEGDGTARIAY
jgi:hypothetical protein